MRQAPTRCASTSHIAWNYGRELRNLLFRSRSLVKGLLRNIEVKLLEGIPEKVVVSGDLVAGEEAGPGPEYRGDSG